MLRFSNGKFKIMQLADIQDTCKTSRDTLNFIAAAIKAEKPDLIVLTGDQLKGYGFWFMLGSKHKKGKTALENILRPIAESGASFAFTFGNHDEMKGFSKKQQADIYNSYTGCENKNAFSSFDEGTVCLPVYGENGKPCFAVYLLDTGAKDENGDYNGVSAEQIRWTEKCCDELEALGGGKVSSVAFEHIPVVEMYELLKETGKSAKGALKGHRAFPDKYFVLPDEMLKRGCYMEENIACPTRTNGQFESFASGGSVIAAYFGHDHINCFNGVLRGVDLGYTPGCGFNVYGPGLNRGVRVFEINEANPKGYKTRVVTYKELLGAKLHRPLKNLMYTYAPSSVETAIPFFLKWLAVFAAVALLAILLKNF